MRAEIIKIVTMHKNGTIDEDQMIDLMTVLVNQAKSQQNAKETHTTHGKSSSRKKENKKIEIDLDLDFGKLGKMMKKFSFLGEKMPTGGTPASNSRENSIHMSQMETPIGEDYYFEDNHFAVSSFSGMVLDQGAEFIDNSVQASHLKAITLNAAHILDCRFNGSSVDQMHLEDATIQDAKFNGVKITKLRMDGHAEFEDILWNGVSIKGFGCTNGTKLSDAKFEGVSITDTTFSSTTIEDVKMVGVTFHQATLSQVTIRDCKFINCQLNDTDLSDIDLEDSIFEDIDFSGQKLNDSQSFYNFVHQHQPAPKPGKTL